MTIEYNKNKKSLIISAEKFASDLELEVVYDAGNKLQFTTSATHRPGLLFANYDEYFPMHRVQTLGNAENAYLKSLEEEKRKSQCDKLFSKNVPCVIITRGWDVLDELLISAKKYGTTLFSSKTSTSMVESDVMTYLTSELAEEDCIYGELLDISGIGVLLLGASGIGKSETALELVHRGHMLVADDFVQVKRIKHKIYGFSNKNTTNLLEVRGVGIIDVEAMFGVSGVLSHKRIHLVILMEKWDKNKEYDRLGNEDLKYNILGVDFKKIVIPVSAGRNLAVVIEAASRNFRLQNLGKSALDALNARLIEKKDI